MKLIKNILALAAIASVATSASAAIVNFSWTGSNSYTATGSIDVPTAADGVITAGTVTSFSFSNGGAPTVVDLTGASLSFSFTFSGGATAAVVTPGSGFTFQDATTDYSLTFAAPNWSLVDGGEVSTATGEAAMTLTVVPEPETYAAVAGAGLVAFGLFRRRATKA